jgi:hypothetical protein
VTRQLAQCITPGTKQPAVNARRWWRTIPCGSAAHNALRLADEIEVGLSQLGVVHGTHLLVSALVALHKHDFVLDSLRIICDPLLDDIEQLPGFQLVR